MKLNKKRKIILAVVAVLVLLPAIFWKQIAIRYHLKSYSLTMWRMYNLEYEHVGSGMGTVGSTESFEKLEYHRDKLIDLGHLKYQEYTFNNVLIVTPESRHFTKRLLQRDCPTVFDFSIPYPQDENTKPVYIEIWYRPKYHNDWQEFFEETDVPDYKTKFQVEEEEKEVEETEPVVNEGEK
jgi:hypothetical protein